MQKKSCLGQFWYIFGPMVIKTLIEMGVSMAASMLMLVVHFKDYMKAAMSGSTEQIMEFVTEQTNEVLAYGEHITIIAAACTIPVMLFLFLRDEKKRKPMAAKRAHMNIGKFLMIIPFAVTAGLAFNNIMSLANLAVVSEAYNEVSIKQYALPVAAQFVAYGFITPICEELIFRGLVYKRFRDNMPMYAAIFGSAMMFGVFHGNIIQSLYAFAMGSLFAYLYEMYGSLKAPVIAHMVINTVVVAFTALDIFTWMFSDLLRVGIVTVMCAAAASTLFVFYFQKEVFEKNQAQQSTSEEN